MTQSPYLPSNGDQDNNPQTGEWTTAGSNAGTPGFDPAAPYGQFDEPEPVTTHEVYVPAGTSASSSPSTTDAAKDEAAGLKDTAVDRGQQVAGVAKDQAGAVKDTAVDNAQHVAGVAKEQAGAVKDTALDNAQHVAEVAKDEVGKVASEASEQLRDLLHQSRTELTNQAGVQQQRLGSVIHSFAEELGSMASKSDKSGPITDLAHEGARRGGEIAHFIENSEPSELLDSVRSFARRRPAVFLAASALTGVLVGRLTRNLASEAKDAKEAAQRPALSASTGGYDSGTYPTGGYETGTYGTTSYATTSYETEVTPRRESTYDDATYVAPVNGDTIR